MNPFSSRTEWPSSSNRLSLLRDEKLRNRCDVIDLTESNPTKCDFSSLHQGIVDTLANPANLRYAPEPCGSDAAREAICEYYSTRGIVVAPGQIAITSGTSEGYSFLFKLLCNPGAAILAPVPSYPLIDFLASLHDVEVVRYRYAYHDTWRLRLNSVAGFSPIKLAAIVAISPNNPTGSLFTSHDFEGLAARNTIEKCPLIVDEVFLDYCSSATFPSALKEFAGLRFVLSGISKVLALPQMKLSWIVVDGPEELKNEAIRRLEIIGDTFLSANTPAQNALRSWLKLADSIQYELRHRIETNRSLLRTLCAQSSRVELLNSEGGWSAMLRVQSDYDDESLALLILSQENVFVHPGYFFDIEEETMFIVSLLVPPKRFAEGVSRLLSFIDLLG